MNVLFDLVVVHCFFGRCGHAEAGLDPHAVHDAMETHYAARHAADIARILRGWR